MYTDRSVQDRHDLDPAAGLPRGRRDARWVQNAVSTVEGVSDVEVNMTFDPPWTPDRMSEEGPGRLSELLTDAWQPHRVAVQAA